MNTSKQSKLSKNLSLLLCLIIPLFASACGGGGSGGDSFVGAAEFTLVAEPTEVDQGDRIKVSLDLWNVHDKGIIVKIKYPNALSFARTSALIEYDGFEGSKGTPDKISVGADSTYLIFSLPHFPFEDGRHGSLTFELTAKAEADKKNIEVDIDVDDGTTFNVTNPAFSAEDAVEFTVKG